MPTYNNSVVTKFTGKYALGKIFKQMGADSTRASRQIKRGNDVLKGSFSSLKSVIGGVVIGGAINRGFSLIGNEVRNVTTEFIEFDHALGKAAAKLNIRRGSEEWKKLDAEMRRIGETSEFTATQAAKSADVLAMSGYSLEQILSSASGAASVATIADMELNEATQVAADTIAAFGLKTEDATQQMKNMDRVTNAIARTAVSSAVSIEQIHETIATSGWAANAAKQDIESYMGLVGLLGDASIRGSNAATVMKNAFLGLTGMTPIARKRLRQIGVVTEYVSDAAAKAAGKMKGDLKNGVEIIADMSEKMKKMGSAERLRFLKDLFGRYGAGIEGVLKLGSKKIVEFRDKFIKSGRTAKEVTEDIRKSIGNKLKVLESMKVGLAFRFMDKVKDKLPILIDRMGDFINSIDVDKVSEKLGRIYDDIVKVKNGVVTAIDFMKEFKGVLVGIGAAWAVAKVVAFGAAIKAATVASLAFVATPFGAVLFAVGSLAYLGYQLKENWDDLGRSFSYIGDIIKKTILKALIGLNDWMETSTIGKWFAGKLGINTKVTGFRLKDMLHDGKYTAQIANANKQAAIAKVENKNIQYKVNNYYNSTNINANQSRQYQPEPWDIEPPNSNDIAMGAVNNQQSVWNGTLNIKGAPQGSTFEQSGSPPMSVEGLGVSQ